MASYSKPNGNASVLPTEGMFALTRHSHIRVKWGAHLLYFKLVCVFTKLFLGTVGISLHFFGIEESQT